MIGKLLSTIKTPADLRQLTVDELNELAREIRHLIKTSVSRNGGHLASNLGVVELTIALHCVFDFNQDRLLWDVGHQSYVHKIVTGRADQFHRLRRADGISGFPSPRESLSDPFYVGHAGTAIASAVGLALGAQLQHDPEKIVAVVGDASIVNGLSFEGLNNTHLVKRQLLIVLNNNSMAIDKTQGAFAQYLTKLRISRSYDDLRRRTELLVRNLPYGSALHDTLHNLKAGIKTTLLGPQKFEQLNIPFYGPVDGHDIASLIKIFSILSDYNRPVILHVYTEKGRGFNPARQDPCTFHSTQPFTLEGETASFSSGTETSFTAAFIHTLKNLMNEDDRVITLTAAMPDGTGLAQLRNTFPDRVIDVGIAESAAVDIAAGLATKGLKPVVVIYSTFMQRSFDQIFQEVALQDLPVILCMDRAGLVGSDGPTHHGFCDISMLRPLPNLVLMAPMDEWELDEALKFALCSGQPCALRYPRDRIKPIAKLIPDYQCQPFEIGRAARLRPGRDAVVLAYGALAYEALLAAEALAEENIDLGVVSARFAKPMDDQLIYELLSRHPERPVITLEDHVLAGGFGSAVLESARRQQLDTRRLVMLGLPDRFVEMDTRQNQLEQLGLTHTGLIQCVRDLLRSPNRPIQEVPPRRKSSSQAGAVK